MIGGDCELAACTDGRGRALPQIGRGLVREREAEDLIGSPAELGDQVHDALGHHRRLPRACSGDDELRSVAMADRVALLFEVEERHATGTSRPSGCNGQRRWNEQ